jgi:hypothetical protein
LKYLAEVNARGALLAAGAVFVALAVPVGASAHVAAHPRHIDLQRPTVAAYFPLGNHGGYLVGVVFEEPDLALLTVAKFGESRLELQSTTYGAHFHGSLLGGRVTADFGAVGSIAVRFRPTGAARERRPFKGCEGSPSRREPGRWVGKVSLHGEGGYFGVTTRSGTGDRDRTFRLRCHVKRLLPRPRPKSLRERVEPTIGASLLSLILGDVSSLQAVNKEDGRVVEMRAAHATGGKRGAEVEAGAFEYQGQMPVGRVVQVLKAPAGTLVTTLPGEHPAAAKLKPGAPFSGEASFLTTSPTTHSWTGTLAVRFPGLVAPLTGTSFFSSLCVVSPLVKPHGCEFQSNLQPGGESTTADGRR